MAEEPQNSQQRTFWFRLGLTSVVVSIPLAYGLVVLGVNSIAVVVTAVISSITILLIWDGSRILPKGLVFWAKEPTPMVDEPTGLFNPAAWASLLVAEEDRCQRYGMPASVIVVRVKDAPENPDPTDDTPNRVGKAIKDTSRRHDVVACLDQYTYAVLAVNATQAGCEAFVRRLNDVLGGQNTEVNCVFEERSEVRDLMTTWRFAERKARGEPVVESPNPQAPPAT